MPALGYSEAFVDYNPVGSFDTSIVEPHKIVVLTPDTCPDDLKEGGAVGRLDTFSTPGKVDRPIFLSHETALAVQRMMRGPSSEKAGIYQKMIYQIAAGVGCKARECFGNPIADRAPLSPTLENQAVSEFCRPCAEVYGTLVDRLGVTPMMAEWILRDFQGDPGFELSAYELKYHTGEATDRAMEILLTPQPPDNLREDLNVYDPGYLQTPNGHGSLAWRLTNISVKLLDSGPSGKHILMTAKFTDLFPPKKKRPVERDYMVSPEFLSHHQR